MLKNIAGISIKGRCFSNEQKFPFWVQIDKDGKFKDTNIRLSILYGKNGSGKTTISKAFSNIVNPMPDSLLKSYLIDKDNNQIELDNPNKKIFVFNEDYIRNNIKINNEGLQSIVLIGEQVELQNKIEKYSGYINNITDKLDEIKTKLLSYEEKDNNPDIKMNEIIKHFKSNWADIDAKIAGNRKNSSVTADIIKQFYKDYSLKEKNYDEIVQQFKFLNENFFKTIIWREEYNNPISNYNHNIKEQYLLNLLSKEFSQHETSEREKLIKEIIRRNNTFPNIQSKLNDSNLTECPYCYQELTEEYKRNLSSILKQIFDTEITTYQNELKNFNFNFDPKELSLYEDLDKEKTKEINQQIKKCLKIKTEYHDWILQKRNNPFMKCDFELLGLEKEINTLNAMISELEETRQYHYNIQKDRQTQLDSFRKINILKNLYENYDRYTSYNNLLAQKDHLLKKKELHKNGISYLEKTIQEIQNQMKNIQLAIEHINYALHYIFFTKGRLEIVAADDKYYLKSYGEDVQPNDISTGETNILALCYFFTQIFNDQEERNLYKNEVLLVLDDPISSFDINNKIGILSFLQYMLKNFILKNPESKILILTHDLPLVSDLKKTCEEISSLVKSDAKLKATTITNQLINHEISILELKNEYVKLLNIAYEYACNQNNEPAIGNIVRKLFEAYATFNFQKGIKDVLSFNLIQNKLGNKSDFFTSLMSRIVLHQESHFEEQINYMFKDFSFFGYTSEDEKRKTAQYVLSFMYLVSKEHILACFENDPDVSTNITSWINNIPDNVNH